MSCSHLVFPIFPFVLRTCIHDDVYTAAPRARDVNFFSFELPARKSLLSFHPPFWSRSIPFSPLAGRDFLFFILPPLLARDALIYVYVCHHQSEISAQINVAHNRNSFYREYQIHSKRNASPSSWLYSFLISCPWSTAHGREFPQTRNIFPPVFFRVILL